MPPRNTAVYMYLNMTLIPGVFFPPAEVSLRPERATHSENPFGVWREKLPEANAVSYVGIGHTKAARAAGI